VANEQDTDLGLYNQWQDNPNKQNFQKIYTKFKPLINRAMSKAAYGSTLPQSAFKLQAAQEFQNALNNYKPGQGAQIHTYVYKSVENKLKRLNYKYANIARQPERSGDGLGVYNITEFYNTKELLRQKLNREPTSVEMADAMAVSPAQITQYEQEVKKDLSLNQELEDLVTFQEISGDEAEIAMHYYDMNPQQQLVFDYATGRHGKPAILKPSGQVDWKALSLRVGLSEAQVQKLRKQITKTLGS
jgi:DNA-directed RNA polymerase specialized sigma subunit